MENTSQLITMVQQHIRSDDLKRVENAIQNVQDLFFEEVGMSMLSYAIVTRSSLASYIARRMKERGESLNKTDKFDCTALDYAIKYDEHTLAELLISIGATSTIEIAELCSSIYMYDMLVSKGVTYDDEAILEAVYQHIKQRVLREYNEAMAERQRHIQFKRLVYVSKLTMFRDELRKKTGRKNSLQEV